jgi:hypothetical protein
MSVPQFGISQPVVFIRPVPHSRVGARAALTSRYIKTGVLQRHHSLESECLAAGAWCARKHIAKSNYFISLPSEWSECTRARGAGYLCSAMRPNTDPVSSSTHKHKDSELELLLRPLIIEPIMELSSGYLEARGTAAREGRAFAAPPRTSR